MWLDQPYKITIDAIWEITYLNQTSEKPGLRKVTNPTVNKLTSAEFDGRSIKISTRKEDDVNFVAILIGYKVYQSNRLNSVSSTSIHVAYWMVKEYAHYDPCSVLLEELIKIKKIK